MQLPGSVRNGLLAAGIAAAAAPAAAQIDEIIVTAQMREQPIEQVPVAVTSLDSEFIRRQRLHSLDALGEVTPGLIIQQQSPNNPAYVIRGISTDEGSPVDAARISMFLNGADISRNRGSLIELYDLKAIEVVKGPQATLFGTAASGGAISVSTALPEEDFATFWQLEMGNYGYRRIEGMVTGGTQLWQGRLAFMTSDREGYVENTSGSIGSQSTSPRAGQDLMARNRFSIRPSLSFTPSGETRFDLVMTREQNRDSGTAFKSAVYAPTGGNTSPFSFAELSGVAADSTTFHDRDLGIDRDTTDFNLRASHQLSDRWTLSSVSHFRQYNSGEILDADGSQAFAFELAEVVDGNQFSQEFRLQFQSQDLTATLGGTWFEEEGFRSVAFAAEEGTFMLCVPPARAFATRIEQEIIAMSGPDLELDEMPCLNADGSVNSITGLVTPFFTGFSIPAVNYGAMFSARAENSSWSVFVDGSWRPSESLELVGGVRYVEEDRRSWGASQVPNALLTGGLLPLIFVDDTAGQWIRDGNSGSDLLPRLALNYRLPSGLSWYLSASKGRRAAVTDVTPALDPISFAPLDPVAQVPAEILWNYETGFRGRFDQNRLYLSLSVFSQDYENFQVQTLTGAGQFVTTNAGSASNEGAEAELRWSPTAQLDTFLHLAYIDAGIDDKPSNGVYAGKRLRLQPETTAAMGYQWRSQVTDRIDLVSSARASYRGEVFFDITHQPTETVSGVRLADDATTLISASLGLADSDDKWRIELFAENLGDEKYLADGGNTGASIGIPTYIPGAPRFVGISYSSNF